MKKRISILIAALSIFGITLAQQEPLNSPAKISIDNNQVSSSYNGKTIFTGTIQSPGKVKYVENPSRTEGKVNQVVMFQKVAIEGEIFGSEAFPCEADRTVLWNMIGEAQRRDMTDY